MGITGFHPILYVHDQYAERDFYLLFGFETVYEGPEFPGLLAIACGPVVFGLSTLPGLTEDGIANVRWQIMVDDVDDVAAVCEAAGLDYDVETEVAGTTHRTRIAKVRSPNGVQVWFEGPNEIPSSA